MKKGKYPVDQNNFIDLMAMGYIVTKFSQYHYRISHPDDNELTLDIWPTVKKYCVSVKGRMESSRAYDDLVELVETKLDYFNR